MGVTGGSLARAEMAATEDALRGAGAGEAGNDMLSDLANVLLLRAADFVGGSLDANVGKGHSAHQLSAVPSAS